MKNYINELNFAKEIALKAGEIIFQNFSTSKRSVKVNFTPVTETDLAISKLVIEEVKTHFPSHEVLDEELQNDIPKAEYIWVCDPVDGTVPFSHRIPTSMFSLALCMNKEPIVAVAYDPFMRRLFHTTKGKDSYMNDKKIHVNDKTFTPGETLFTIPYWLKEFDYNCFFSLMKKKKIIVSVVESVVYLSMSIALGSITGAIMPGAKPWDRAAAKLIIENAGGSCTDENLKSLSVFGSPNFFVASNGVVHDELIDILRQCRN